MDWFTLTAPEYIFAQYFFLKLMILIYFIVYASLFFQVRALYGSKGILPIRSYMKGLEGCWGKRNRFYHLPTVFWFNTSDVFIQGVAGAGMMIAFFALLGTIPTWLAFFLLWVGYISFQNVGQDFLAYQWDSLLSEVGFVCIFFAMQSPPSAPLVLVLWLLLFRLVFSSGIVKLRSGDVNWRKWKALNFHYLTQPLPHRVSWYMDKCSDRFKKISVAVLFFIELVIPFFIFLPGWMPLLAFIFIVLLQLLIFLTGNYGFFNILTIAMCLMLLNNSVLPDWESFAPVLAFDHTYLSVFNSFIALILFILNIGAIVRLFATDRMLIQMQHYLQPFYIANSYGLFAVMTTERLEYILEGSVDGVEWKAYEFHWKPCDVSTPPRFAALHMPRLDWQFWFAALNPGVFPRWLHNFLKCIMEKNQDVLDLLSDNPFPKEPPRHLRLKLYRYTFSSREDRDAKRVWWVQDYKGSYTITPGKIGG